MPPVSFPASTSRRISSSVTTSTPSAAGIRNSLQSSAVIPDAIAQNGVRTRISRRTVGTQNFASDSQRCIAIRFGNRSVSTASTGISANVSKTAASIEPPGNGNSIVIYPPNSSQHTMLMSSAEKIRCMVKLRRMRVGFSISLSSGCHALSSAARACTTASLISVSAVSQAEYHARITANSTSSAIMIHNRSPSCSILYPFCTQNVLLLISSEISNHAQSASRNFSFLISKGSGIGLIIVYFQLFVKRAQIAPNKDASRFSDG